MADQPHFVDATVFLGMHHRDDAVRDRSLAYFRDRYVAEVWMNYEQIGICDAVIWRQRREVQDLYYPFMDRLHSDMQIVRLGYRRPELELALGNPELRDLAPEQALLAGQVLARGGLLATHDAALRALPCLRDRLWDFAAGGRTADFPAELQALYEVSRVFVYTSPE